jgi:hypothetical protein
MTSGCFQTKSDLKGRRFQAIEDNQKKYYSTESYFTTGVPDMFPTVTALLG